MEVAQHGVAVPPTHEAYGVWVYPCHEKRHFPSCTEVVGAGILWCETDGGTVGIYYGSDERSDFFTAYILLCMDALDGVSGGVAGGAVLEKLIHSATQGLHRKTLGRSCLTGINRFSVDPVILGRK